MLPPEDTTQPASRAPEHDPEVWDEAIERFNPSRWHAPEPPPLLVSVAFAGQRFDIEAFLAQERSKDMLRFSTAGSVDDGKSTLIGRLLFDTQSVYDDQLRSIEGKGTTAPGVLDLALLTDGLRAEREQAITIDVAYRFFSTAKRKFIIADTPGHEQYTRNMATGASTADAAIVLLDARKGVLVQSRHHAFISALLGVSNIIVAVNKMDLVEYDAAIFRTITAAFRAFFGALPIPGIESINLHFIPVCALHGDNVVHRSGNMPWFEGSTLLSLLESLPSSDEASEAPFRLAVQRVVRTGLDFRGFAGQIASGTIRKGEAVSVLPSGSTSRVGRIVTHDGDLEEASAPLSVTLTLEDELDISRGEVLADSTQAPVVTSRLDAFLVWMDSKPLDCTSRYVLKQMTRSVQSYVRSVLPVSDFMENAKARNASTLLLNEIGIVSIEVLQALAVDPYRANRHTGSFVLIDAVSNHTVAAGMIRSAAPLAAVKNHAGAVTQAERTARFGHVGAHIMSDSASLLEELERALFERGALVVRFAVGVPLPGTETGILSLSQSGEPGIVVSTFTTTPLKIALSTKDTAEAVAKILRELTAAKILF